MYKVNPNRNIFLEIDNITATCSVGSVNLIGLRSWFDVTKSLDFLINKTKSYNNKTNNRINDLKKYFMEQYKIGNFPKKPTIEYLSYESNFSEDYIKKVLNNTRGGSRDFIIGMCLAFKLNIIESNLLLKSSGYNELYDKDIRDVIIIKSIYDNFINIDYIKDNNTYIIDDLNEMLKEQGLHKIDSATSKLRR